MKSTSFFLSTLIFVLLLGCGKASHVPVTGKVLVDGAPMEGVTISFLPDAGGVNASATTNAQGEFKARTSDRDGCLPGAYSITVVKYEVPPVAVPANYSGSAPIPNPNPPRNILPDKYAKKDASGLSAEVKSGMSPLNFEISTK